MQTKTELQNLLCQAGIEPNKRLGQHFLIDLNLMRLLVESAEITKDDLVLEVGCGTGSLTSLLVQKAGVVTAVEYDKNLAYIARQQLADFNNVELINTDILETKNTINPAVTDMLVSARKKLTGRFMLIANLPYNVASPLMMNLIKDEPAADAMYVTIQKEVAERMTAEAGSSHYGILSLLLNSTGDVKKIRTLKPNVFWPMPKVDSAMVGFVRKSEKAKRIADFELFSEIVHFFMAHRRKTISSISKFAKGKLIKIENWGDIFQQSNIDPKKRPEQLTAEEYIAITNNAIK